MGFSLICICPGSYVNRLTCRPGQNPLSRSAISACFREPGHSGFLNSYRLADGIGGIRPILELARCPGFRINRLTFIPGQQKLSRFAKIARNREPGQRILAWLERQTIDAGTGTFSATKVGPQVSSPKPPPENGRLPGPKTKGTWNLTRFHALYVCWCEWGRLNPTEHTLTAT